MTTTTLHTASVVGIEAHLVTVDVTLDQRLPCCNIAGLPARQSRETEDRVRCAIQSAGFEWPHKRINVVLSPPALPKYGCHYDLAIAMGILRASGQAGMNIDRFLLAGELGLSGDLRPVWGALLMVEAGFKENLAGICCHDDNVWEAVVSGARVLPAKTLEDAVRYSKFPQPSVHMPPKGGEQAQIVAPLNMSEVKGQTEAVKALEHSAALGYNTLLIGPPGCGKTMIARRFPGILPPMTLEECMEVTRIFSASGLLEPGSGLIRRRPFRAPHHTITGQALTGGGVPLRPGEATLAHNGVLMLDELPEFSSHALSYLREVVESEMVTMTRRDMTVEFPAKCYIIGTANNCLCGASPEQKCVCETHQLRRWHDRIDRLADQFQMTKIEMEPMSRRDLQSAPWNEPTEAIQARVVAARKG